MNNKYDNLLLIYYSGTGNSKRVSEWIAEAAYEVIYTIVQWSLAILIFTLANRLMHYLAKYTFFSRLIAYTSFTYWKFWRRYKTPARF
jgi:hypothetical protein